MRNSKHETALLLTFLECFFGVSCASASSQGSTAAHDWCEHNAHPGHVTEAKVWVQTFLTQNPLYQHCLCLDLGLFLLETNTRLLLLVVVRGQWGRGTENSMSHQMALVYDQPDLV